MRSSSRSFASGDETPHAHETWCVRKAANTSAGELSAGSSGTISLRLTECGGNGGSGGIILLPPAAPA